MSVEFRPYQAGHFDLLMQKPCRRFFGGKFEPEYADALEKAGESWSAFVSGEIVGCAGLAQLWSGRAIGWAFLSDETAEHMLAITRKTKDVLQHSAYRRIEAHVDAYFPAGRRWAEMLGMSREGFMRQFSPNGDDMFLYALVK
jgi:RimJ/RimL family protein N-acetyltransferase